jgi:hypothetical protein
VAPPAVQPASSSASTSSMVGLSSGGRAQRHSRPKHWVAMLTCA